MRKYLFLFLAMMILCPTGIVAQDDSNALDYLPPSFFISGWEATGNELLLHPEEAAFIISADLDLLLEYDMLWYATETYEMGEDEMTIELYEFSSASGAFGYYSMSWFEPADTETVSIEHPYDMPPAPTFDTVRRASDGQSEWLEGYQDRFYFRIYVVEEELNQSGMRAGIYLLGHLPGTPLPAGIISALPPDDLVRGTEAYIAGPIGLGRVIQTHGDDLLGFENFEVEAASGEYRLGGGKYCTLIVAEYADFETCEAASAELLDYMLNSRDWEGILLEPVEGINPRGFGNDTYMAFWTEGIHLYMIWDAEDASELQDALELLSG